MVVCRGLRCAGVNCFEGRFTASRQGEDRWVHECVISQVRLGWLAVAKLGGFSSWRQGLAVFLLDA